MNTQAVITLIVLVLLGFIGFCIYFIFKILQFVIQATNLYKDMVTRQDVMIKLLKDIRDKGKSNGAGHGLEEFQSTKHNNRSSQTVENLSESDKIVYEYYLEIKKQYGNLISFNGMVLKIMDEKKIKDENRVISILKLAGEAPDRYPRSTKTKGQTG